MSTYGVGRAGGAVPRTSVTEWTTSNFKALEHASLPLTPLNVLAGANSSGKSSLIQSLLLLAQSTDDEIILNGPLARLGEGVDVVRSGTSELSLGYSTKLRSRGEEEAHEWSFEIGLTADGGTLGVREFHAACDGEPVVFATASRVTARTRAEVNPEDRFGETLLHAKELMGRKAPAKTFLSFRGLYPEAMIYRRTSQQVLASLRRNFSAAALKADPDRAFLIYEDMLSWLRSEEGQKHAPEGLVSGMNRVLHSSASPIRLLIDLEQREMDALYKTFAETTSSDPWIAVPMTRYGTNVYGRRATPLGIAQEQAQIWRGVAIAVDSLRNLRESIRYLGPLREEPQVVSATGGRNRNLPAGPKGEYTADLLARSKNEVIRFRDSKRRMRTAKLPEAVSLWTTYLGVGETVAVEDQGKLGRGLRIAVNGVERDLTTVGVGASQVLPVIAVVLAASRGSVILLEQPELHLHPAVQSRLADFFVWARPDLTIVVETHSEYLITRLRRRAAEGKADSAKISILFAEQKRGVTQVRRLRLNQLGDLSEWPVGFFDTQDEETRALVSAVRNQTEGRLER